MKLHIGSQALADVTYAIGSDKESLAIAAAMNKAAESVSVIIDPTLEPDEWAAYKDDGALIIRQRWEL